MPASQARAHTEAACVGDCVEAASVVASVVASEAVSVEDTLEARAEVLAVISRMTCMRTTLAPTRLRQVVRLVCKAMETLDTQVEEVMGQHTMLSPASRSWFAM